MERTFNSMLSKILLCVLALSLQVLPIAALSQNETDKLSLLTFKQLITTDPLRIMNSWNESVYFCHWNGVSCSTRHEGRVIGLELYDKKLGGSITPHIGNLSFLRSLDLGTNNLRGQIPEEIGRLFRLRYLNLSDNSLEGEIPRNLSFCSKLQIICLMINKLSGAIPNDLSRLVGTNNLELLYIAGNYLSGDIPSWLGNISSLTDLSLSQNNLGGSIPTDLGRLSKLIFLQLGDNKISGTIPPSIYNLSSLQFLEVTVNKLNGKIPADIGLTLPNLLEFGVAGNFFHGGIPASLTNASKLQAIALGVNNFSGLVPQNFGSLRDLSYLGLGYNRLENDGDFSFLASLANCSSLETLLLANNNFKGELPIWISNLSSSLKSLQLHDNQISGSIPSGIGRLIGLNSFILSRNFITGEIPATIGNLERLSVLDLGSNGISGPIPSSIGNITQMLQLGLEGNKLSGAIPISFGNFLRLERLSLSDNKLSGNIPKEVMSYSQAISLSFKRNSLTGPIPEVVGNMSNLVDLDVSYNKFIARIPDGLGSCLTLEHVQLQGNFLNGSIPSSFRSLRSLRILDVSRNNLSGQILPFFQNFTLLQELNFSFNDFQGEVPNEGVFRNVSAFSVMGNKRLCGGIKKLGLPPCEIKGLKKHKTSLDMKLLIPILVASVFMMMGALVIYVQVRKRKSPKILERQDKYPRISYAELSHATGGFSASNLIGEGSFGSVYRGILGGDVTPVAVKVLNLEAKGATKSFMAECETLRNIRHRNLIKILTVCSSLDLKGKDFKAIVYEFMQNGSLEEWLHPSEDQVIARNMSFLQRLNVAIDTAFAMEYLHNHCQPPVIHGDLKPSNILLDHDMVAHVSDFGLSKFQQGAPQGNSSQPQSSSSGVKGTLGYVAPEYGMGTKPSIAGDVYSFGILLLEMITGKRPTDAVFEGNLTLHQITNIALPDRVTDIIEPSLLQEAQSAENCRVNRKGRVSIIDSIVDVARIALLCSTESPNERMEMKNVAAELVAIRDKFQGTVQRRIVN